MGEFFQTFQRLGTYLLSRGLLTEERLAEALRWQAKWGSRLGDIVLAKGWIRAYAFYGALAEHYQRPFIDLFKEPPQRWLFDREDVGYYADLLLLPWRRKGGITYIALADPSQACIDFARNRFGNRIDFVITSKFDIIWQLQKNAGAYLSERAVNELFKRQPEQSALEVVTPRQVFFIGAVATFLLAWLSFWPLPALIAINVVVAALLFGNFGLRALLAWVGGDKRIDVKIRPHKVSVLDEKTLPVYTILVPMYKEEKSLPHLANALRRLDYPFSKLDIKLILEEDDEETIEVAKGLGLEANFEIIRVPPSLPKTKPKACNYALNFARGELVTIYDAEDKPEPDQLKKVVAAFAEASPNTVCIQARLNYFNVKENWITRMFTLEYSLWFDFYLPALEALRIPIPLGGTSNHFRMEALRKLNAWDPYNVTEDADLGVRMTQLGYRVGVVNSTTFEEANTRLGNWIRQRSRWIKGYMQTYLVHMRRPVDLYKSLGHTGFWGFQFFIGGTVFSTLLAPWLFAMYIVWLFTHTHVMDPIFPPLVLYLSLFNLIMGNGFFIYVSCLGAFKRHYYSLIPYALTMPVYWLLMSVAAYKALWQLVVNPFYWEKTEHGLTQVEHAEPAGGVARRG